MSKPFSEPVRPLYERSYQGLLYVGLVRIGLLLVFASGAYLIGGANRLFPEYLLAFYIFGLSCSVLNLAFVLRKTVITRGMAWAQLLVDFCFVAATVSFTGGAASLFTFAFVIVILEAGLTLGLSQGFVVASFATTVAFVFAVAPSKQAAELPPLTLWYSFAVQTLAFYLTASVSGFWSLRVRRLQDFQSEILDNMSNGFLITNPEGKIVSQNKAADRILEVSSEFTIGQPVQRVLRVESGAECPVITAIRAQRDFSSYEFACRVGDRRNEKTKLIGITTSRLFGANKRLESVIASFVDLTEMARMRQELQRQDRLALVGELAAGLAHEVRNPVAAILSSVEELDSNLDRPDIARKLTGIAARESNHLNGIVTGFLDFAGNPTVRRDLTNVVQLVDEVVEAARNRSSADIMFEIDSPGVPCMVSGDRSRLRQVFQNIVQNAIEAMNDKGLLRITILKSQGYVELRFDDEGPGIEPDKIDRVFEPFYTTRDTGVGMGLAVCHRIITAHDGTIRAASREGGGASLIVRLPAAPKEEEFHS